MYKEMLKNIIIPFLEKVIKKRKILDCLEFLNTSQWWSDKELKDYQWAELQKLLGHAYEQVPYWKDRFGQLGMSFGNIKTYEDFQKIPIITKNDIRSNKDRMIANNWRGKTWTKATGGSTGVPLELDYTPESYAWRVACSKRGYSWAGCEDGVKQGYIWGVAIGDVSRKQRFKESVYHAILRQKYFNCFKFDEQEMSECLDTLNKFKPNIIVGYTNPLYNFSQFVKKSNKLKFQPKSIISAAEKLHEFQRNLISETFGCKVFNTYGSREFMLIASECDEQMGLHINVENLFVEIIKEDGMPAKDGEMGELIITDLHNYGMPFIRYKIGDMAIASNKRCKCGRGLPLLEDVTGRSLDMLQTPDGRKIPGEFFPHLMKEFKGIERFQVIQDQINSLEIKIVKNEQFNDGDMKILREEIMKIMGNAVNINFDFVSDIPLTKTGKYRVTISHIK